MSALYDPDDFISKYFTYNEVLFLPKWYRRALPEDGLTPEILDTLRVFAEKMDEVREFLGRPMVPHSFWRSEGYNKFIKGAENSAHMAKEPGIAAVDFHCVGKTTDQIKDLLEPELERFGIRMENNGPGSLWIHLDNREVPPCGNRYFIP